MTPGPLQLLVVLVLVIFFFGASRVPGIMENLGKGINSFKKGLREDDGKDNVKKSISHDTDKDQKED